MLSLVLRKMLRLLTGHVEVTYEAMTLRCAANKQFRRFHADE